MTYFVETVQFKQMISYTPYAITKDEKKKVKYTLLDHIKSGIGDKWERLKDGTRQALDMVCFLSAELGFFYASDDYLADRHDICDKTIRSRLTELEKMGQVVKVYRRAKRCNGRGKPVYLFVNHPYFQYWVKLLNIDTDFHSNFHTENDETSCGSRDEGTKKVPTYSLPKKQEKDINISDNKIVQFVVNRVKDSIHKGTTIKYLSSYINHIVTSLERQAIHTENNRQMAIKKRQQEQNSRVIKEIFGTTTEKVPFYNWLEQ